MTAPIPFASWTNAAATCAVGSAPLDDEQPVNRAAAATSPPVPMVLRRGETAVTCCHSRWGPAGALLHPDQDPRRREAVAEEQKPYAVGQSCVDCRVQGTPLIVVLGHRRCGAIKAAYKAMHDRTTLPGNLQAVSASLRTAYEATVAQKAADPVDAMIRVHARQTAAAPRSNTSLSPLAEEGDPAAVSACYSLDTGSLNGAPTD